MPNEALVRQLIRGSIQRAIVESVAALFVVVFCGAMLPATSAGSARFYGCLVILVGSGFIAGVVWSHALSYGLLRSHPASDATFWRAAFHAQARLLRLAPLWYCAPLGLGLLLFLAPTTIFELPPFLLVATLCLAALVFVAWLNLRAASCLEQTSRILAD
jgi:hypothetical protein